jgi:hypothetical protein
MEIESLRITIIVATPKYCIKTRQNNDLRDYLRFAKSSDPRQLKELAHMNSYLMISGWVATSRGYEQCIKDYPCVELESGIYSWTT